MKRYLALVIHYDLVPGRVESGRPCRGGSNITAVDHRALVASSWRHGRRGFRQSGGAGSPDHPALDADRAGRSARPQKTLALAVGDTALAPAGFHHYSIAKGTTVVEVTFIGPYTITYVNDYQAPRQGSNFPYGY
jgi:hypothetical protein